MTSAFEHSRTVLAAIIPDRHDLLDRALRDLTPQQIPDRILANLFTLLARYSEITGAVLTRPALGELLAATRSDAGTIVAYQEAYDELSQIKADEPAFRWSLMQLRELAAERTTREALNEAMEILTKGVQGEKADEVLRGHGDARKHALTRFADIDRDLNLQDAPEGDMRGEGKDILADYRIRKDARLAGRGGGIQFGVPALDERVGGLHPGELVLLVGYTSDGKSIGVDSPVLTPSGFTRMGDLSIGDALIDPKGSPSVVTGIFPQGVLPVYRLTFSDGSTAEATEDHLWSVRVWKNLREKQTEPGVRGKQTQTRVTVVMTTKEIAEYVAAPNRRNPVLDTSEGLISVDFEQRGEQPLDPYALGLLLGDGHFGTSISFSKNDEELADYLGAAMPNGAQLVETARTGGGCRQWIVRAAERGNNPVRRAVKQLDLDGTRSWNKFVPEPYKWTSAANRLAMLQGLMDTDGGHERGRATFSSASEQLRDDVVWLARSLGFRAEPMKDKIPTYDYQDEKKAGRVAYRCSIWEREDARVFRLGRKIRPIGSRDEGRRVEEVTYVRDAECQCISVSATSKLYVTNDFVPTHNTSMAVQLAWSAAVEQGKNVLFLTTETIRAQVRRRSIARHSCLSVFGTGDGLNSRDIKDGTLSEDDERIFTDVVGDFDENPGYGHYYIAQIPRAASMEYIESKALRVLRSMPVDLIVMDYLALLKSERKRTTDREELSGILKAAKQMSTTFNDGNGVPFVSPWQVSRTARIEAEKTGFYTLNALSETAETSNSADTIISLLAPLDNESRRCKVKTQVMKHRDGEKANSIELMVDYATSKFTGAHQQGHTIDTMFDPLSAFM